MTTITERCIHGDSKCVICHYQPNQENKPLLKACAPVVVGGEQWRIGSYNRPRKVYELRRVTMTSRFDCKVETRTIDKEELESIYLSK